jgi:hypothetical protein
MKIEVRMLKHGEGDFYSLAGPFALSKEVHKDLGEPLSSAPGMTWWFALTDGVPVGFCTLRETDDSHWLDYHWTVPVNRGKGIQKKLAAAREKHLATLPGKPLRMAARSHNWAFWEQQGFAVANRRGDWCFGVKGDIKKPAKKKGSAV